MSSVPRSPGRAIILALIAALLCPPASAQTPSPIGAGRPVTLPSYPDRPVTRPRPPSGRPPAWRPPGARPPIARPPIARPPIARPPHHRPPLHRPPYRPSIAWGYRYPVAASGGFAGTIRCESFGGRFRSCPVMTRSRAVLERRFNGRCRYGHGWGFDRHRIWVAHNCRGRFAYGIGGYVPRYRSDGPDAGLIIGGVAVAAGLVALLSRSPAGRADRYPSRETAALVADLEGVAAPARAGLRACLDRASRNIAATGGDRLEMTDATIDQVGRDLYRYDVDLRATWPDMSRAVTFSCTASATDIEDFDFVTEA